MTKADCMVSERGLCNVGDTYVIN